MGDTSETNTKVLSRELFLGVVALKRLYRKIIICATRTLFSGTVTYYKFKKLVFCHFHYFNLFFVHTRNFTQKKQKILSVLLKKMHKKIIMNW